MKNAVPAQSYYGAPVSGLRLAPTAGAKIAAPSAPYIGRNRCIANDDTCEGPKARGTDYCIGHLRSQGQAK
jgi:hypothetical protein